MLEMLQPRPRWHDLRGFSEQHPLHGLKAWQPILEDCSDCGHVDDDLYDVCPVHSFVLSKLREMALGMPTGFCYCIHCDQVICSDSPWSITKYRAAEHSHGFHSTLIKAQSQIDQALTEFRGGVP